MANTIFHIVQIARAEPPAVEIIKTFTDRAEAEAFASKARREDSTGHFEYVVKEHDPALKASRRVEDWRTSDPRSGGAEDRNRQRAGE